MDGINFEPAPGRVQCQQVSGGTSLPRAVDYVY